MELLMFCLSATYLAFSGPMYQQIYGTVVVTRVGDNYNPMMEDVEQTALATTESPSGSGTSTTCALH